LTSLPIGRYLAGTTISGNNWITINGDSGHIYLGQREKVVTRPEAELAEIASWRSQKQEDHSYSGSAHSHPAGLGRAKSGAGKLRPCCRRIDSKQLAWRTMRVEYF